MVEFTGDGGPVTVSTEGSGFDTVLAVYETDGRVLLDCDDDIQPYDPTRRELGGRVESELAVPTVAGRRYAVQVGSCSPTDACAAVTAGNIKLRVSSTPPNDDRAHATPIVAGAAATSTNTGSTLEAGEPTLCGSSPYAKTVWFRWTAPVVGTAVVSTSGFDTVLAVYRAGATSPLGCNDDAIRRSGGSSLPMTQPPGPPVVVAPGDYLIQVGGYYDAGFTTVAARNGPFEIQVSFTEDLDVDGDGVAAARLRRPRRRRPSRHRARSRTTASTRTATASSRSTATATARSRHPRAATATTAGRASARRFRGARQRRRRGLRRRRRLAALAQHEDRDRLRRQRPGGGRLCRPLEEGPGGGPGRAALPRPRLPLRSQGGAHRPRRAPRAAETARPEKRPADESPRRRPARDPRDARRSARPNEGVPLPSRPARRHHGTVPCADRPRAVLSGRRLLILALGLLAFGGGFALARLTRETTVRQERTLGAPAHPRIAGLEPAGELPALRRAPATPVPAPSSPPRTDDALPTPIQTQSPAPTPPDDETATPPQSQQEPTRTTTE